MLANDENRQRLLSTLGVPLTPKTCSLRRSPEVALRIQAVQPPGLVEHCRKLDGPSLRGGFAAANFRDVHLCACRRTVGRAQYLEVLRPYTDNIMRPINCDADKSMRRKLRHRALLAGDVKACIFDAYQLDGLAETDLHMPSQLCAPQPTTTKASMVLW